MSSRKIIRARSDDAIEARREALLDAARDLLAEHSPMDISLAAICGRAGLVKSALYRYFESREDVLIEVLLEDMAEFEAASAAQMAQLARNDYAAMAASFAELVAARPRMATLLAHLASILERNISVERIIEIKLQMRDLFAAHVAMIAKVMPELGSRAADAALAMHAQVTAWHAHCAPNAQVAEALAREDLAVFRLEYRASLEMSCRALLIGMAAEAGSN